ncbi:MAG: hypothetical protein PVI39_08115, partial [Desulfobacteraceae bacterium]
MIGIITVLAGVLILALISRHEAISQRNRADQARNDAEGLIEFMIFNLRDSLRPIGRLDLLDSVNQRVNSYYDELAEKMSSPDILRRQGVAFNNQGDVLKAQGRTDEALTAFMAGKDIAERLSTQDPNNTDWARDLSISFNKVGDVL